VPGVVAVVRGPDDLVEGERFATVEPAGEADVVVVVAFGDFDEAAGGVGEQVGGGAGEIEAAVVVEAGRHGVEDVVGGGAAAADDNEFGECPSFVETDGESPRGMTVVFEDV
jgi:hypothetical protein